MCIRDSTGHGHHGPTPEPRSDLSLRPRNAVHLGTVRPVLHEEQHRRSLGKTGICYDNAVSESFFATYKKELIHTRPWPDLKSLREETVDWIKNYYNPIRRHSTLGYLTPREYELGFRNINQLAA